MSLATKYRPSDWEDVTEQESVKKILEQQLSSGEVQHAYLFSGGAGTGKTTTARIFAKKINNGKGNPLELDAASNNSVDDIRNIIQQVRVQSMDSEYRIVILDEVHALSSSAWQALLKILEEPPKKAVFILCTTNPEKIPKTILSRVQRFDFKRISHKGIVDRLQEILRMEFDTDKEFSLSNYNALSYIARISEGGMRDAITLLEKCLAYSKELTLENVISALGTVDYDTFFTLTEAIQNGQSEDIIKILEDVYADGKDLKQFVKDYMGFLLDINKYDITKSFDYLQLPQTYEDRLQTLNDEFFRRCQSLLPSIVKLNTDIKWESQSKVVIEVSLLSEALK